MKRVLTATSIQNILLLNLNRHEGCPTTSILLDQRLFREIPSLDRPSMVTESSNPHKDKSPRPKTRQRASQGEDPATKTTTGALSSAPSHAMAAEAASPQRTNGNATSLLNTSNSASTAAILDLAILMTIPAQAALERSTTSIGKISSLSITDECTLRGHRRTSRRRRQLTRSSRRAWRK